MKLIEFLAFLVEHLVENPQAGELDVFCEVPSDDPSDGYTPEHITLGPRDFTDPKGENDIVNWITLGNDGTEEAGLISHLGPSGLQSAFEPAAAVGDDD
jgi:hypothetical protein